jgi:hypothetical protein
MNQRRHSTGARWTGIGLALLVGTLAVNASSAAATPLTYWASPKGGGSTCSKEKPCNIVLALASATSGDRVVPAGDEGTYGLPESPTLETFTVPVGVTVEGAPSQPRPTIYAGGLGHAVQLG